MARLERPGLSDRLVGFVSRLSALIENHYKAHYPNLTAPVISWDVGNRYIRIVRGDNVSRSVHCFIDRSTGDVLKPASWNSPAKHARSNVYADDYGLSGVNANGANYLKLGRK